VTDKCYEQLRRVAGDVSRETFDALCAFADRFMQWNARINLVASSTQTDLWARHILDSAQILPLARSGTRFLDLGSGGGFPALITAFLLRGKTGAYVDMVESNRKKAAFLSDIVARFDLPAKVHACRIEDANGRIGRDACDVVTARALAALPKLLDLASPWLGGGATGLFHKGRDYAREVAEADNHWQFDMLVHPSATEPNAVILEISGLTQKATAGQ
jgi:16S rRNA (guanine527-N7)-methyltransferase